MRHKFRFSIATLLMLMLVSALLAQRFFRSQQVQESGFEEWSEAGILSYSIALVDASYPKDSWGLCAVTHGDGNYLHLAEGGNDLRSFAGGYFELGVQLPYKLSEGWTSELRAIADRPDGNIRKLLPGEVIAMQYGHPICKSLVSGTDKSVGSITVVKADRYHATLKIDAKIPLRDWHASSDDEVLEIDRTLELDLVAPEDPRSSIPRRSQITKR